MPETLICSNINVSEYNMALDFFASAKKGRKVFNIFQSMKLRRKGLVNLSCGIYEP